jgi:hypothetical protein
VREGRRRELGTCFRAPCKVGVECRGVGLRCSPIDLVQDLNLQPAFKHSAQGLLEFTSTGTTRSYSCGFGLVILL